MAIYDNFPYTNIHEMNLRWVIEQVKQGNLTIEDFSEYLEQVETQLNTINDMLTELNPKIADFEAKYPAIAAIAGSNAGNSKNFIYFNNGVPTATTENLGDTYTHLYLDDGILKAGYRTRQVYVLPNIPSVQPGRNGDMWFRYGTLGGIQYSGLYIYDEFSSSWQEIYNLDLTNKVIL